MTDHYKKIFLSIAMVLVFSTISLGQGTEWTYQGRVLDNNLPPTANYDFEFSLWDSLANGTQQGATQGVTGVAVANGIFTVRLDFGAQFDGSARFLQIAMRPSGGGAYTPLAPRQPITSAPYAIRSLSSRTADTATNALQLGGVAASQYVVTTDPRMTDERNPLPGSTNYIWNQNSVLQPSSNFIISGNGFLGGTLEATTVNATTTAGTTAVSGVASAVTGITFGGNFTSNSTSGIGVFGNAPAATGFAYGVHGRSDSVQGRGVYGWASANTGDQAYGVYGRSDSTTGRGVYGFAQSDTGVNYGVYGQSNSSSGAGVYGFAFDANGVVFGVRGVTNSTAGRGVFGTANALSGTTYGGRFENDSISGRGVFGWATTSTGTTYGGEFRSDSSSGRGVTGTATANTGTTYGGRFESESTQGTAAFGLASAPTGTTVGGYFESTSSGFARGVVGLASAATAAQTFGGYFESNSTSGRGVYGSAAADFGTTFGGYFTSSSTGGIGAFGATNSIEGSTYGVWGQTDSTSGIGVYGYARANSGTTYGVYGDTDSPNGYAGYFTGPAGSQNYFQRNVGIGVTSPSFQLHLSLDSAAKPTSNTWTISSDRRLKKNIQPIDAALDKLLQLYGVTYQWKDPASQGNMTGTYTGMIAQDVEKVFPEWVREGSDGFKTLTVIGFEGIVVESMRELRAEKDLEIAQLRALIEAQQKQISALKKLVCAQNATAEICGEEK